MLIAPHQQDSSVRAAWRLPAPYLAEWVTDNPVDAASCTSCHADRDRAIEAGLELTPLRTASCWVWERHIDIDGDGFNFTRTCQHHGDLVRLINGVYGVLDDADALLQLSTCLDCATRQGLAWGAGTKVPGARIAEFRMQLENLTTVDVCEGCATGRAGGIVELLDILGELASW